MLLYSFSFFIFFTVVLVLFWKIPKRFQWVLLLLASYYFYASWKPAYLGIIILTTLVNYLTGLGIVRFNKSKTLILLAGLFVDLGLLFTFKYFDFFSISLHDTFATNLPILKLILPIGISFYTLQVVGYLFDVYRDKSKPERHLGHFALFTCFFPQILAGPIERSTTLLPQLKRLHNFDYGQASEGARLFMLGLFKKLVIADNLALVVDRGFGTLPEHKGLGLILIIFFYSWQIYMDFSGYTDMARGVGKMIGINLLENFNLPYLATSIQDFWRRWHISLSNWFKDYIYVPLGGSRRGLIMTIFTTFIVFTTSGLWHGAAWTFIIWGTLHAAGLSFERVAKKLNKDRLRLPTTVKIIYTYFLICVFWVFFRSPTLNDAFYILKNSLVGIKSFVSLEYIRASINQLFLFNTAEIIITFSLVMIAIFLEISQRKLSILERISSQPAIIRYLIYALVICAILQLRNAQIKEFIYTQF